MDVEWARRRNSTKYVFRLAMMGRMLMSQAASDSDIRTGGRLLRRTSVQIYKGTFGVSIFTWQRTNWKT